MVNNLEMTISIIDSNIEKNQKDADFFIKKAFFLIYFTAFINIMYLIPNLSNYMSVIIEDQLHKYEYSNKDILLFSEENQLIFKIEGGDRRFSDFQAANERFSDFNEINIFFLKSATSLLNFLSKLNIDEINLDRISLFLSSILWIAITGLLFTYRFHKQKAHELLNHKIILITKS